MDWMLRLILIGLYTLAISCRNAQFLLRGMALNTSLPKYKLVLLGTWGDCP